MSNYLFLLFILPCVFSIEIPNCSSKGENDECSKCNEGYVLTKDKQCLSCYDSNCGLCYSPHKNSCVKCKNDFILINKKCGKQCDISFDHCRLCSEDTTQCIQCEKGYELINGTCSGLSRNIVIIVCIVISILIIVVVMYCLFNTTSLSKKFSVAEAIVGIPISNGQMVFEKGGNELVGLEDSITEFNEKPKKEKKKISMEDSNYPQTLTNTFDTEDNFKVTHDNNMKKVPISNKLLIEDTIAGSSENLDTKTCDYCMIEPSVTQLKCGCRFCEKHKDIKKLSRDKDTCPVCKAKI